MVIKSDVVNFSGLRSIINTKLSELYVDVVRTWCKRGIYVHVISTDNKRKNSVFAVLYNVIWAYRGLSASPGRSYWQLSWRGKKVVIA